MRALGRGEFIFLKSGGSLFFFARIEQMKLSAVSILCTLARNVVYLRI
jgi:hypothetical protein